VGHQKRNTPLAGHPVENLREHGQGLVLRAAVAPRALVSSVRILQSGQGAAYCWRPRRSRPQKRGHRKDLPDSSTAYGLSEDSSVWRRTFDLRSSDVCPETQIKIKVALPAVPFRPRPPCDDCRRDPPARTELALHFRPHWLAPAHYILKHTVDDILLKNSQVAVAVQVLL